MFEVNVNLLRLKDFALVYITSLQAVPQNGGNITVLQKSLLLQYMIVFQTVFSHRAFFLQILNILQTWAVLHAVDDDTCCFIRSGRSHSDPFSQCESLEEVMQFYLSETLNTRLK